MANTIKPTYGTSTDITPSGLQSLTNTSSVATAAQSNSSTLAQDYLVTVTIAGTAASTAFCQVYLLSSQDDTNFDTQASATLLGTISLTATPQSRTFSIVSNGNLLNCPEYFEIMVVNNTGATLASSGNSIKTMSVNLQIV